MRSGKGGFTRLKNGSNPESIAQQAA